MNLRQEIIKEHSKAHALSIAAYACASKNNFAALMRCFLDDDYRLAQRAAWSVSWAARRNPEMVQPHLKRLVSVLEKKNVHAAVVRNAVRVLQEIDIPKKFQGDVMAACFRFLGNVVKNRTFLVARLIGNSACQPEGEAGNAGEQPVSNRVDG